MKNLVFVLICVLNFSCSGCNSTNQREDKIKNKVVTITRFFPEEVKTNTTFKSINDSIRLIVKIRSSDNEFITSRWESGDTIWEDKYRDNRVEINLSISNSKVFFEEFDKNILEETMPKEFMVESKIIAVWYESFNPKTKMVKMRMNVCKPETDYCYLHNIYVSTSGKLKIELEDIN